MFNAVIEYVIALEQDNITNIKPNNSDMKKLTQYAIQQIRFEIRIAVYVILLIVKFNWFCLQIFVFWMPQKFLYKKYRRFMRKIPIISSVLMLYETLIFMIYFEAKQELFIGTSKKDIM